MSITDYGESIKTKTKKYEEQPFEILEKWNLA